MKVKAKMLSDTDQVINALARALEALEVNAEIIARVTRAPDEMSLAEIGLDSKDLLLLDFQLEENDGLNIRFDDLREDMTVTEVARHIKKVTE